MDDYITTRTDHNTEMKTATAEIPSGYGSCFWCHRAYQRSDSVMVEGPGLACQCQATDRMSNHPHCQLLAAASAMQRNDAAQTKRGPGRTEGTQAAEFKRLHTAVENGHNRTSWLRVWHIVTMWDEMRTQMLELYIKTTLSLCSMWKSVCRKKNQNPSTARPHWNS